MQPLAHFTEAQPVPLVTTNSKGGLLPCADPTDQPATTKAAAINARSNMLGMGTSKTLQTEIRKRIRTSTHMMSDELHAYDGLSMGFAGHDTVKHSIGEYVRENVHTIAVASRPAVASAAAISR